MNIALYIDEFCRKKRSPSLLYDMKTAKNLLVGDGEAALASQECFEESEYLAYNIKASVRAYSRNKDIAIHIYRDFLAFLKAKNGADIFVEFPPIAISNTFERLMFIAKYLQDPRHKVSDLPDLLWVSQRTISDDIKRLCGDHEDPIQICGKVFAIEETERHRDSVYFPSTAHPLFLTPNLTQVLVTLKGLKKMSDDPLYAEYARLTATDIWEQLSDYAKTRIQFVLSDLLPEDLSWYANLRKSDQQSFHSEVRCSVKNNVALDCIKNGKPFYVEYESETGLCLFSKCTFVPQSYSGESFEVDCDKGRLRLELSKIVRSTYTVEEMM